MAIDRTRLGLTILRISIGIFFVFEGLGKIRWLVNSSILAAQFAEWSNSMPPLTHTSGGSAPPVGAEVNTANASPRTRTVCRSSRGVRGSERLKSRKRCRTVDIGAGHTKTRRAHWGSERAHA